MNEKGKAQRPKKNEKKKTGQKKEDELRKAKRLNEEHKITITIVSEDENLPKEKIRYKFSKDISDSGIKIQGNVPLPVDTILKIDLTLQSLRQKITALGKVKWVEFNTEDGSFEAGVEFVDTSSEAIWKIEDYILSKQKFASVNPLGVPFWIFAKFNSAKSK
jgi:c-di-GMP-binding flagellar brake protein YcgR